MQRAVKGALVPFQRKIYIFSLLLQRLNLQNGSRLPVTLKGDGMDDENWTDVKIGLIQDGSLHILMAQDEEEVQGATSSNIGE